MENSKAIQEEDEWKHAYVGEGNSYLAEGPAYINEEISNKNTLEMVGSYQEQLVCETVRQSATSGIRSARSHLINTWQGLQAPSVQLKNKRRHVCPTCNKAFNKRTNLRLHLPIHSIEKPHRCKVCFRSFKRASYLSKHKIIHSKVKPYQCLSCPNSFRRSDHLRSHMKIHQKSLQ